MAIQDGNEAVEETDVITGNERYSVSDMVESKKIDDLEWGWEQSKQVDTLIYKNQALQMLHHV